MCAAELSASPAPRGKVLLITSRTARFAPYFDGGSILVDDLIAALSRETRVDIVYLREREPGETPPTGVSRCDWIRQQPRANRFNEDVANAGKTVRFLLAHGYRYTTIIAHHMSSAFGAERLPPELRSKIVVLPLFTSASYACAGEPPPAEYVACERRFVGLVAGFVSPSAVESRQLIEGYGVSADRTRVVARGVDLDLFTPQRRRETSTSTLLCVGALKPQKNQPFLVDVTAELVRLGYCIRLVFAGAVKDHRTLAAIREAAARQRVACNIEIAGGLHRAAVADLMATSLVGVSASLFETFGRGIAESLASGLPILMPPHLDAVLEWAGEPGRGLVVAPLQVRAFAEMLVPLIRDGATREAHAAAAPGRVRHLGLPIAREQLCRAIFELVEQRPLPRVAAA